MQQRTFVSDAAHELKTAVAVVKSSLQLLNMKRRSPDEYQAGLERCLADSQRLEEIVAKMLTLAREESSASAGPQPTADIADCLRQTAAQLATAATLRSVEVEIAAPERLRRSPSPQTTAPCSSPTCCSTPSSTARLTPRSSCD